LRTVTIAATPSVSSRADTASGLETASQNPPAPARFDSHASAASGRTTTSDRKRGTRPSWSAPDGRVSRREPAEAARLRGGASDLPLDGGHPPLLREPDAIDLAPAAEDRVVDVVHARPRRILRGELPGDGRVDGPEAVLREERLRGARLDEADEVE